MFIKKPILLAATILLSLALVSTGSTIKEENAGPVLDNTGKNENEKFVNKKYAHKELVYGDDEEEDSNSASKSPSSSTTKPIIPNQAVLTNLDYAEFGGFEKPKKRRVDTHNEKYEPNELKSFHRAQNVQKSLLHANADRYDFDYDQMIKSYFASKVNRQKEMKEELDSLLDELVETEEENSRMDNRNFKNVRQHRPIENVVQVKEKLIPEKEYNKQFIKQNPSLYDDIETNMLQAELVNANNKNLLVKEEEKVLHKAINTNEEQSQQPQFALKQNNHHYDPSIN